MAATNVQGDSLRNDRDPSELTQSDPDITERGTAPGRDKIEEYVPLPWIQVQQPTSEEHPVLCANRHGRQERPAARSPEFGPDLRSIVRRTDARLAVAELRGMRNLLHGSGNGRRLPAEGEGARTADLSWAGPIFESQLDPATDARIQDVRHRGARDRDPCDHDRPGFLEGRASRARSMTFQSGSSSITLAFSSRVWTEDGIETVVRVSLCLLAPIEAYSNLYETHYLRLLTRIESLMPAPGRGHQAVEKLSVTLPKALLDELEVVVRDSGYWLSVVDFIREGTVEKLERWKREHPKK